MVVLVILVVICVSVWAFQSYKRENIEEPKTQFQKKENEYYREIFALKSTIKELKEGIKEKDKFFNEFKDLNSSTITKITSLYSDFILLEYEISEKYLKNKSHPAIKEASRIADLKKETKIYIQQYKEMLYKYEYLLQLFPELVNFVEDFQTIKELSDFNSIKTLQGDFDRVKFYLSKEEYKVLSENQRNQLALDRYIHGQKSKWQIGRDYELFVGISYEGKGWSVDYYGMNKKLDDLGRDLIAYKGNKVHVIQCKYWSKTKTIHEKHITQLFGTTVLFEMEKGLLYEITPVFITNIKLSVRAKEFARKLGVKIMEEYHLKAFPRVKCNVNRDKNGEITKIYHLPFDQQYDRTKIINKDEFYAFTVEEAAKKGFRRAFRHFINN